MDEIKDMQKSDDLGTFLDNSGVRTNPFGRNIMADKAYKRAERIVAAFHLLSNHVSETEPVRVEIRRCGLVLLSGCLELRDELRIPGSAVFIRTLADIRHLISLARILSVSGFVSRHNAEMVVEALDELGNLLSVSQRSSLSESVVLTKDELLSGGEIIRRAAVTDIKDKTSIKDIRAVMNKEVKRSSVRHNADNSNGRAQGILQVLKTRDNLSIKDIASHLPEYSEKMIQRELAQMVAAGSIKKTGSKRWSRYAVV